MPFRRGRDPLPPTFKCRVCARHKASNEYSIKQLQLWHNRDRRSNLDPDNIGLTCKSHGLGEREIRCHGPCDHVKVVSRFSKNQRNDPEPWCIDCTEWKGEFNGNEIPTPTPACPISPDERDGIKEEEFQGHDYATEADDEYENRVRLASDKDDDDYEDEDAAGSLYDEPTPVTLAFNRLDGYDSETADGSTTIGDRFDVNSLHTSLLDREYINGDSSGSEIDSDSEPSTRTVTGKHPSTVQSRLGGYQASTVHNARGAASYYQGFGYAANDTQSPSATSTSGIPPHLRHVAPKHSTNYRSQSTQLNRSVQTGQHTKFGSHLATAPQFTKRMTREEIDQEAEALTNEPPRPNSSKAPKPSDVQNVDWKKENSKWFKGDNRKVFPGKKKRFATRVQDRTEVPHDSDSSDTM